MKGTVFVCLRELVIGASDEVTWRACILDAGFDPFTIFTPNSDVAEERTLPLITAICKRLNLTLVQAADAFGEHWVNVYSPRLYKHLYSKHKTSRAFFEDINAMHQRLTRQVPNARPPRFVLEWKNDKVLVMHYQSGRSLIDIAVGMARAIGRYYGEALEVTRVSDSELRIAFP